MLTNYNSDFFSCPFYIHLMNVKPELVMLHLLPCMNSIVARTIRICGSLTYFLYVMSRKIYLIFQHFLLLCKFIIISGFLFLYVDVVVAVCVYYFDIFAIASTSESSKQILCGMPNKRIEKKHLEGGFSEFSQCNLFAYF